MMCCVAGLLPLKDTIQEFSVNLWTRVLLPLNKPVNKYITADISASPFSYYTPAGGLIWTCLVCHIVYWNHLQLWKVRKNDCVWTSINNFNIVLKWLSHKKIRDGSYRTSRIGDFILDCMSTICSILCLAMFFCNRKTQKSTFSVTWLEEKDKELKVLKQTRLIRKSRENTTPAGEKRKKWVAGCSSSIKTTTVNNKQEQKQTNLLPLGPVLVLKCCGQIPLKYLGFQPAAWMKRKPFLEPFFCSSLTGHSLSLINTSSLHFHRYKLSSSLQAFCQTE